MVKKKIICPKYSRITTESNMTLNFMELYSSNDRQSILFYVEAFPKWLKLLIKDFPLNITNANNSQSDFTLIIPPYSCDTAS